MAGRPLAFASVGRGAGGEREVLLASDGVTRVVRVGATVRLPVRPFTETVQQYLAYLRRGGIDFVPEPLGYDDRGREVSFSRVTHRLSRCRNGRRPRMGWCSSPG